MTHRKPASVNKNEDYLSVHVGSTSLESVDVDLVVKKPFHIQQNPTKEGLIPTQIFLEENPYVEIKSVIYPQGTPYSVSGMQDVIFVYASTVHVQLILKKRAHHPPLSLPLDLKGRVKFQPCDDRVCYRPMELSFLIPIARAKAHEVR